MLLPLLATLAFAVPTVADAPARVAPPAQVFALVIGNNRSSSAARPDLRYADDDALKYGAMWRAMAPAGHVRVLTTLDGDTARDAAGEPPGDARVVDGSPKRADVDAAAAALAAAVNEARAHGRRTALYFVFAGHGDVLQGKGVLELEDGALATADLKSVLDTVGADVTHVLLDSCNSFFVLYPRRPGGAVIASSNDLTGGLSLAKGELGAFLSTSAEAQVYEWSQLEAGIFSHVVRSGLSGAADADGDERISYAELRGFVSVATKDLGNAQYRPRTFVKAPSGNDVFLDLRSGTAPSLTLTGFRERVTLRDGGGRRLMDVHPEPAFVPRLRVPAASVELSSTRVEDGRRVAASTEVVLDGSRAVDPSALVPAATARGTEAQLARMFSSSFGPSALAAAERARVSEPPQVFGITAEQEARFRSRLVVVADTGARVRWASAATMALGGLGGAAAMSVLGVNVLSSETTTPAATVAFVGAGACATYGLGTAGIRLLVPTQGERWLLEYDAMAHETEMQRLHRVAVTVDTISSLADDERRLRYVISGVGIATGGLVTAAGLFAMKDAAPLDLGALLTAGTTAVLGSSLMGAGVGMILVPSDTEVMLEDLRRDPTSVVAAAYGEE